MTISAFVRWFLARAAQHQLVKSVRRGFDLDEVGDDVLPAILLEADSISRELSPGLDEWTVAFCVVDRIDETKMGDPAGAEAVDALEGLQRIGDALISQVRNNPLHHFRAGTLSRTPILGTGGSAALSGYRYEFAVSLQPFPRDAYADAQFDPSWVAPEPGSTSETPYPALTASQGLRRLGNDVQVKLGAGLAVDDTGALTVTGSTGGPGQDGQDGVGLESITQLTADTILVTLTDGSTQGPFTLPAGPAGQTGEPGLSGQDGVDGRDGVDGNAGVDGVDGVGIAVITQLDATTARITLTDTSSYDLTLPAGPQGQPGATGETGAAGPAGSAATVSVGTVTTGAAGSSVSINNSGTSSAAILNFTIPRGDTGAAGPAGSAATVAVGTITTGAAGSSASITNAGTSSAAVFNFIIPRGDTGATGPAGAAASVAVGTVTTGTAGSSASVSNSGTSSAAVLNFVIPRGDTGATGAAGANGKSILYGLGNPSSFIGTDGDWYIDNSSETNPVFWGPKAAGAWPASGNSLVGPTGPTGPQGSGFTPKGAWAPSTSYNVNDIVTYNGSTYRRTIAGVSGTVFNASNWELWAAAGVSGGDTKFLSLLASATALSIGSTTSETLFVEVSIPGNTFPAGTNLFGNFIATGTSGTVQTLRLRMGTSATLTSNALIKSNAMNTTQAGAWGQLHFAIRSTTSVFPYSAAITAPSNNTTGGTLVTGLDFTQTIKIQITGQKGATGDTFILEAIHLFAQLP